MKAPHIVFDSEALATFTCSKCNKALYRSEPITVSAWGKFLPKTLPILVTHLFCNQNNATQDP